MSLEWNSERACCGSYAWFECKNKFDVLLCNSQFILIWKLSTKYFHTARPHKPYQFYRASAYTACTARYCFTFSVCTSVCPSRCVHGIVPKRMFMSPFLTIYSRSIVLVFEPHRCYKIPRENSWGVKCTGCMCPLQ